MDETEPCRKQSCSSALLLKLRKSENIARGSVVAAERTSTGFRLVGCTTGSVSGVNLQFPRRQLRLRECDMVEPRSALNRTARL
jgi:hypothetical protein